MIVRFKRLFHMICSALLLMFFSINVTANAHVVELSLKDSVSVSKSQVVLSDVGSIKVDNIRVQQALAEVNLGATPRMGYSKTFSQHDIEKIITRKFPAGLLRVKWAGADKVRISSDGDQHSFEEVASIARDGFMSEMNKFNFSVAINHISEGQAFQLPTGKVEYKYRVNSEFIGQKNCVWVDVFVDNELYRTIPVWINADVRGSVLVAKNSIAGKTEVVSKDFIYKDTRINGKAENYVSLSDLQASSFLVKSLERDEAVLASHLKKMPDVIGGKVINVDITQGNIRIRLQGVARKDAIKGEVLRVVLLHNNEAVMARVVDKQLVNVI